MNDGKILGQAQLVDGVAPNVDEDTGKEDGAKETSGGQNSSGSSGDYFAQARLSRQQARDEAVDILNVTSTKPVSKPNRSRSSRRNDKIRLANLSPLG